MEKTTLYLPPELQVALREVARREGRSQAEVAREALERYVAAAGAPQPRSVGAFEQDPARGEPVPAKHAKQWVHEQWGEHAGRSESHPEDDQR